MGDQVASHAGAGVPDGIDIAGVSRFLAQHVSGGDGPLTVERIAGGASNLTYTLTTPSGSWVLRRPPLGHVLPTAHDMAREYRVLAALAQTDVPVPRPLALCEDASVTGAPFYLMERCYGLVAHEALPEGYATTPAERQRISAAMIETLARLHAVDWQAAGLEGFGRPEGFLARQVRRWGEQWQRSKTREIPAMDRLRDRLAAAVPASPPATIVHGDFRLGNLMLAADDPGRIVAVFDWEMATIGDPLADLGWTLGYWIQPDDPPAYHALVAPGAPTTAPGFLTRDDLAQRYATLTGRDLARLDWYIVFALYKLAVIVEGIHARFLAGETVGAGFEVYGPRVAPAIEMAVERADAVGL